MKSASKVEFGDFQTPHELAREVCVLLGKLGENPGVILEPTAGRGAFMLAAVEAFPKARLMGWEINSEYVSDARAALNLAAASARSTVTIHDFFTCDWESVLSELKENILILGNLPWVTNSGVAVVEGTNLPVKENFIGLRGIAARTGKSNFDISESMLIRLLRALRGRPATLAILCKTATSRKFLRYAWQSEGRIESAALYRIDAAAHFNAAVDGCLLLFRTGAAGLQEADVYPSLSSEKPASRIGLAGRELVANLQDYRALRHLEGHSPFRWRSGVKHDCAAVMELVRRSDQGMETAEGLRLDLEEEYIFPLLKCTDLSHGRTTAKRLVIITQRFVGDDTAVIADRSPRTWAYLQSHRERFEARKSSIYKGRVPFSLFGIGEYAFAPWKVAVSGLHTSGRFQIVGPMEGRPMFFDDASYYLSLDREEDARLVAGILNSPPCQRFLAALVFPDSKRPYTVDLLQRLNLAAIAAETEFASGWEQFHRSSRAITADVSQLNL